MSILSFLRFGQSLFDEQVLPGDCFAFQFAEMKQSQAAFSSHIYPRLDSCSDCIRGQ
jgi:hypothetical protein